MTPRLYSISTVCLLKHYNQDYLLHALRTDFTGSNGVGKSIIADLFQIVFVADTRFIKFATEGIDKKKRKIEGLPYDSAIGYVFFNVEVTEGYFLTLGTAIFQQGQQLIKPFLVTASIDLESVRLEQHTFSRDKLMFSSDLLKPNREPYTLDELARNLPDKNGLYIHYFNSKDERGIYYNWLYKNELLPINLVKEGNLKAYAKVIQSFSKSKALDIDSSKSLIEYLFEEDEVEISQEYHQQEQVIRKLLHQFKTTQGQIDDISNKQTDLRELKASEEKRNAAAYRIDVGKYLQAYHSNVRKQGEFDKLKDELDSKTRKREMLRERSGELSEELEEATTVARRDDSVFTDLAGKRSLFRRLEELNLEEKALRNIDASELVHQVPPGRVSELLEKDARYYEENISESRAVLRRYNSIRGIEKKRKEQDEWLQGRLRTLNDREKHLSNFRDTLQTVERNNLFVQALAKNSNLTKVQQAILVHLRSVLIGRPPKATEGLRYTEAINFIDNLEVQDDKVNKGWWLTTGKLHEFVPETSMLLPDLSAIEFNDVGQLKAYIDQEMDELQEQKKIYADLQNGIMPKAFSEYDFDIDLSDATKIKKHQTAAHLIAVVNHKLEEINNQQKMEIEEIEKAKTQYGISFEGVAYEELLDKTKKKAESAKERQEELAQQFNKENTEIASLESALPFLKESCAKIMKELEETQAAFVGERQSFQSKYPEMDLPGVEVTSYSTQQINQLERDFVAAAGDYTSRYNQIVGKYNETKDHRDIRINEQIHNQNFNFEVLEQVLLGSKIRTVDEVTGHLETLNSDLLAIADELSASLIKVFGKTEDYFDRYKELVNSLNDFFRGKLISNRFYFRIDFEPAPKLDIKWIEYLRRSASGIAAGSVSGELSPEQFIEEFYLKYSGNRSRVPIGDLLNPKRYFVLKGKLTDKNDRDIPGSTGESYTAIALLGIARLSVVQDGDRAGLRFIILEESATLDNVNFNLFPTIAKQYGYQIVTMTPKPYAIGDDEGWFIHQLIPGKENEDINYPKTMSYFRTNKSQMELTEYLKARSNELANV